MLRHAAAVGRWKVQGSCHAAQRRCCNNPSCAVTLALAGALGCSGSHCSMDAACHLPTNVSAHQLAAPAPRHGLWSCMAQRTAACCLPTASKHQLPAFAPCPRLAALPVACRSTSAHQLPASPPHSHLQTSWVAAGPPTSPPPLNKHGCKPNASLSASLKPGFRLGRC